MTLAASKAESDDASVYTGTAHRNGPSACALVRSRHRRSLSTQGLELEDSKEISTDSTFNSCTKGVRDGGGGQESNLKKSEETAGSVWEIKRE